MDDSIGKKMLKSGKCKICTLPDEVLHSILSFLDMKEVVATSLLSTRWRYLWVSLPVLNFSEYMWKTKLKDAKFAEPKRFMDFVDKVLFLRDGSNINKFQITCSSYCDSDRIDAWLTAAARRQFQEIHFEMIVFQLKKFPYLLFSSSMMTVLKIDTEDGIFFDDPFQIPNSICSSPVLKTLLLCDVKLPEGNSEGELVFSCPALENLTLKDCEQAHLDVLNISAYHLKNLVIHNVHIDSCHINICTPNLSSIDFKDSWYEIFCLENVSSLVSAKFEVSSPHTQHLIKVLGCVSCPTIEVSGRFEDDEEVPDNLTRPFTNIRSLKFTKMYTDPGIILGNNRYLWKLLNLCPWLETLHLDAYEIDDQEEQCPFPITFHHLKYVEIGRVTICQGALRFLKFLLKNAIILEKLVIAMEKSSSDLKTKHEFGDRIHSLPRNSPRLTVVLLN